MKTKITEALLTRYLAGNCTPDEEQLIAEWYGSFEHASPYIDNEHDAEAIDIKAQTKARIKSIIAGQQQIPAVLSISKTAIRRKIVTYGSVAAAILILLTAGLFWVLSKNNEVAKRSIVKNAPPVMDTAGIIPGANKAILTLADGSSVVLDNAANGTLALQNNVQVVKSKDGELQYQQAIGNGQQAISNGQQATINSQPTVTYNILSTPRGGQYMIVLPDGSKVWLNAASSIKYPTAFTGDERRVEITGEVYFEVAKLRLSSGQKMPFKVIINKNTTVEVLGTHFNVNAYDDEGAVKTTLLEGSVKVNRQLAMDNKQSANENQPAIGNPRQVGAGWQSAILKPGEQAISGSNSQPASPRRGFTSDDSRVTIDHSPDLDAVMAWKNGLFQFNNVTIETVMRQVARWYDVEVVYERDVSQDLFHGKIYRNTDISQLLKILELSGAHFKIEGKKVIVQ